MAQHAAIRVLVTGASGFLGGHVLQEASAHRLAVTGMGRGRRPSDFSGQWIEQNPFDDATALPAVDACIHLAWPTSETYATAPENMDACAASIRLIRRLRENGCVHVVAAGSCAEYAAIQPCPVQENGQLAEETLYGKAKNLLHKTLTADVATDPGMTLAWARLFQLYGSGEKPQRLLPHLARLWQKKTPFQAASCTQVRDYLHARDAAGALVLLTMQRASGIFNVCSGVPVSLSALILQFGEYFPCGSLVHFGAKPERNGWEPPIMYGCNKKLCALGWRQTISLADGLQQYAHALQQSPCEKDTA